MAVYHIVALPEKNQKKYLNNLKNKLYTWWYRYSSKPSSSDVHITLTQIFFEDIWSIKTLKKAIIELAKKHKSFSLPYLKVTDKINKEVENEELKKQYPNWWWWVSLFFENKNNELWLLTTELIEIAKWLNIDDMSSYIDKIKTVKPKHKRTKNILDYTANHMNICNYALPEKTKEAKAIIEKTIQKKIKFDTLALRNLNWKNEFEIKLND